MIPDALVCVQYSMGSMGLLFVGFLGVVTPLLTR